MILIPNFSSFILVLHILKALDKYACHTAHLIVQECQIFLNFVSIFMEQFLDSKYWFSFSFEQLP